MLHILVLLVMTIMPILAKNDVLSKIEAGESFNVRLRFINTQDYLCVVESNYSEDDRRRRVLTFPLGEEIERNTMLDWLLEPVRQQGQENAPAFVRLSSIKHPGEYLIAGTDDLTLDENRRKVYTWKETGTDFSEWGGPHDWLLLENQTPPEDQSASNSFIIRNKKFNEDLYVSKEQFELNPKYRAVYTWRQDIKIENSASEAPINAWEIIIQKENPSS
ncbi:uncharacterized protein LOC116920308 isoform X2 [Daphnia magna]|uniref:uncharacterized protein LOC116920308 isoform X2 n=1 Tax=Daphnia magna TaxID=35525 RepID=UPI001E1BBAE4|nr:uncharacterized protein LOC116920308 isoform X2 [Daphnia magna]